MVTLIAAGCIPCQALPEPLSAGVAAVPSLCHSGSRPASSLSSKTCNFLYLKPVGLEGVFVPTLFAVIFLSQLNSPVWAHPTLCQHLVVSQLRAGVETADSKKGMCVSQPCLGQAMEGWNHFEGTLGSKRLFAPCRDPGAHGEHLGLTEMA